MTLRARLLVWFNAVQAIGLVVFGILVWTSMRHALETDLDGWLWSESVGLERFLRQESLRPGLAGAVEEAHELSAAFPADAGFQILDGAGRVIFSHPAQAEPSVPVLGRPASGRVSGQRARLLMRRMAIGGENAALLLWRLEGDAGRQLVRLGWRLALVLPLVLLAAAAGGWWMSRGILRPLDELTAAASRVSLSDLGQRLPIPAADPELARFCAAWNQMLDRLERSAERLRQFTSDASHELRTPLSFIRTCAELALRHPRAPDEYRRALADIRQRTLEMGQILEQLLDMARADAGSAPVTRTCLDWRQPVEEAAAQLRPAAEAKHLALAIETPGVALPVLGDSFWLRRLALLLMDNAIKFTSPGGSVRVCLRPEREVYVMEIADTGCGIAPDALPHIFDRFYQADASRSTGGAGLGLSIARWIVGIHGGEIEVLSRPGQGTRVLVRMAPAGHASWGSPA